MVVIVVVVALVMVMVVVVVAMAVMMTRALCEVDRPGDPARKYSGGVVESGSSSLHAAERGRFAPSVFGHGI